MFFEFFFEIFKKFQILFFQYIKLQLEVNNVDIIFDNCAIKCQNSVKTRLLDTVLYLFIIITLIQTLIGMEQMEILTLISF